MKTLVTSGVSGLVSRDESVADTLGLCLQLHLRMTGFRGLQLRWTWTKSLWGPMETFHPAFWTAQGDTASINIHDLFVLQL
jgi:hypothetical protein